MSFIDDDAFEDSMNITQGSQLPRIAPNFVKSQIDLITGINSSELFIDPEIAKTANCSARVA
jgi:hypothetical protein